MSTAGDKDAGAGAGAGAMPPDDGAEISWVFENVPCAACEATGAGSEAAAAESGAGGDSTGAVGAGERMAVVFSRGEEATAAGVRSVTGGSGFVSCVRNSDEMGSMGVRGGTA